MSRPSAYTYKSPPSKLIKLFRDARENWKRKCLEGTKYIKYLKNRIHFLEASKQKYKEQVQSLQATINHLRQQVSELEDTPSESPSKKTN